MDDKENIFLLIAAAQESQQAINGLLTQLDNKILTLKNTEVTLIRATRDAIGGAVSESLSNEKKTLGDAVINAKMTFRDLRPASLWDYMLGAFIGSMIGAVLMAGLFYWLIKSNGIGQRSIELDTQGVAKMIIESLPKHGGTK
jgi:glycerol uptake facilitator-like aquaporin